MVCGLAKSCRRTAGAAARGWRSASLLTVAAALLTSCASSGTGRLNAEYPEKEAQIERRLNEIFDAARGKRWEVLEAAHFYGPKFSKFGAEKPGRQDASETREFERAGLAALDELSMQAKDLKIDVLGEVAVATFILDFSFRVGSDVFERRARATMVMVLADESWRIFHEHFSAYESEP